MRIPHRKVYRAFREFDRMTDEECERYLVGLRRQGRMTRQPKAAFVLALPLVSVPACVGFGWAMSGPLRNTWVWLDRFVLVEDVSLATILIGLILAVLAGGIPSMIALLVRDRIITRVLEKQVSLAACADCRQSLIGLPLGGTDDRPTVRCPECGVAWELRSLGLVADHINVRRV